MLDLTNSPKWLNNMDVYNKFLRRKSKTFYKKRPYQIRYKKTQKVLDKKKKNYKKKKTVQMLFMWSGRPYKT